MLKTASGSNLIMQWTEVICLYKHEVYALIESVRLRGDWSPTRTLPATNRHGGWWLDDVL